MKAFAFAAVLVACSCATAPSASVRVASTTADSGTGLVREIHLAPSARESSTDFLVSSNGTGSFWRVVGRRESPGAVTLASDVDDIGAGATLAVTQIDRRTGRVETSPPYTTPHPADGALLNGSFAAWRGDGTMPPATWFVNGAESSALARERRDGRNVAVLSLTHEVRGAWNVVELTQQISAARARFDVDVRASEDCDSSTDAPRRLSGVSLYDRSGNVLTYCVGGRGSRAVRRVSADGRQVVVAVPREPGPWQTLHVRLRDARPPGRLAADGSPVRVGFGIKVDPLEAMPAPHAIAFANVRSP